MSATTLHDIAGAASAYRQVLMAGVQVLPDVVPADRVDAVLRTVHHAIRRSGLEPEQMDAWEQSSCAFPPLIYAEPIDRLRETVVDLLRPFGPEPGQRCGPQIVWHWPDPHDAARPSYGTHVDTPPEWATEPYYSRIVAVALTDWTVENGAPWAMISGERCFLVMPRGSLLVMAGDLPHGLSDNRTGMVRAGVFFRWAR